MDRIDEFIQAHGLHRSVPVDISIIEDVFNVRRACLSASIYGLAYPGQPEQAIIVNRTLARPLQRLALAHEASHLLLDHPPSLYMCQVNAWLHSRYELQAHYGAAQMLICRQRLNELAMEGLSVPELAEAFYVPDVLIELRLRQLHSS